MKFTSNKTGSFEVKINARRTMIFSFVEGETYELEAKYKEALMEQGFIKVKVIKETKIKEVKND
jgi:hypothetical protein